MSPNTKNHITNDDSAFSPSKDFDFNLEREIAKKERDYHIKWSTKMNEKERSGGRKQH